MALFLKQDFSPPLLSRKWIATKFRPNVLLCSREHIISILESGLLFREDSEEVERGAPAPSHVWAAAGGGAGGWLTHGERAAALVAVGAAALACPPSWNRGTLARVAGYVAAGAAARAWLRARARGGALRALLDVMRAYLALARRAAACVRDHAVAVSLGSVSQALQATHALLCQQQAALATLLARASAALLGNAPWLRARADTPPAAPDTLQKIHHTFLVVQSSLLKHIAMAHFAQPAHAQAIYKNHNERLYWIHNVLIQHLYEEFKENYEALDRMYRIFKNYGTKDAVTEKKPGFAINDRWLYSEVHSGIARACMEIKIALEKCTSLDMFLDSCAINDQELNLDALNGDIESLIDDLTKVLATTQNSQLRLKNLQRKFGVEEERKKDTDVEDVEEVVKIEEKLPEIKDEVFFLLKTDDDDDRQAIGDVTTAPGKKEKETTKLVLNELRRKLVKREDVMRERERQALVKTMPDLRDVPEFPRQIKMEDYVERKGYIKKIIKDESKDRLFRDYKISSKQKRKKNYKLKVNKYDSESDIKAPVFEANVSLNGKSKLISVSSDNKDIIVTEWNKKQSLPDLDKAGTSFSSIEDINEAVNDSINQSINRSINQSINNVVDQSVNESINEAVNKADDESLNQIKFSKKDLEMSSSSSETDFDYDKERQMLKDIRRHRVARRKNHPVKRVSIDIVDESLKPVEYSFGTGMAIASVLQVNNGKVPNMAAEEVFIGDGEVSNDSGNDEDA